MRVLILADAQFAKHERALIERVVVGLTVEGIDAQLVLPKDRGLSSFRVGVLGDPIWYAERGLLITRKIRAAQIARSITERFGDSSRPVDIVHVLGGGAWGMGLELARTLDAGLALEVWRAGLANQASNLNLDDEDRVMFLVPERGFEDSVRESLQDASVQHVPWGASVADQPVPVFREGKLYSIVLMGSGRQQDHCLAAYNGIAEALSSRTDTMLFANQELVERVGLWNRVKKDKLQDRFTVIDRSEDRRDLLLRCDMLAYPETLHEERTLLLDAMGAGLVVIAGNDEKSQPIVDDSGVIVIPRPSPDLWKEQVGAVIASRDRATEHATKVREYIRTHRRSGLHIEALSDAYADLVGLRQATDAG
jgi:glycosyltransferase involved in cell wall biosynthesis